VCVQAYKKLAMQWHPDKFQDEEDKKTAEKKFMDIAAAKEVLLDEGTYTYVHL
jgi:DnaJ family protein C protein 3